MTQTQGAFVFVVGPSGAGKDSVIAGAKSVLAGDSRFVFARRTITRPVAAGGEYYTEATPEGFAAGEASGAFCLHWRAHDLDYGIPRAIEDDLAAQRCVVANVSRSVLDTARTRYENICIVNITAPIEVLAERIARRGREDAESIRERLQRATQNIPMGDDVVTLENVGLLDDSVRAFTTLLRRLGTTASVPFPRSSGNVQKAMSPRLRSSRLPIDAVITGRRSQ